MIRDIGPDHGGRVARRDRMQAFAFVPTAHCRPPTATMADLREKRVELILQQLEELPTLPAVALRVLQVTADDTSSATDVVQLIGSDPALTTRILQLTRRADMGARGDIHSIERAVLLLGFDAVRAAVLAVSVF